ncbi:MAG: FeoA family protein [Firmicutes bacterium]|nr:FeoA family protein [Bacillota bacterium]
MRLSDANAGETYAVKDVVTGDQEMEAFLFRLGCYSGEPITVISKRRNGCVVAIKDGRYNLDKYISSAIIV